MQRIICEILKSEIESSGVAWLDRVCGLVEPLQVNVTKDVIKKIPAYREPSQTGCNVGNDYIACVPDTGLKSIIYMESDTPSQVGISSRWTEYELPVTIVCWLNLKQINPAFTDYSQFANELLNNIPEFPTIQQPVAYMRAWLRETKHSPDVFTNYDYDEAEQQFLIYPFDYFSLTVLVRFRFMNGCYTPITLDPSPCKTY